MQNPVSKLHSDPSSNLKAMGRTLAASLVAVALLTGSSSAFAGLGEPFNDIPPWQYQPTMANVTVISSPGWGASSGIFSIETKGDVDYFVFVCSPDSPNDPPRYVSDVHISFINAKGDLDIRAYSGRFGAEIGVSQGTGDSEKIFTAGNLSTVVLKVYGYRDAIGDYSVGFSCR